MSFRPFSKFTRLKQAALSILAAIAPLGAAGAVAAATAQVATSPQHVAVPEVNNAKMERAIRRLGLGGPVTHVLRERPLSGLEIRAVRLLGPGNASYKARYSRSKYQPDGLTAKMIRALNV